MDICPHSPDDWIDADDGCTYCEQCNSGVCWNCGAIFIEAGIGVDTGFQYYDAPCNCEYEQF